MLCRRPGPGPFGHPEADRKLTGYIFKRFLQSLVVLLLVTVIMFMLFHLLPGTRPAPS